MLNKCLLTENCAISIMTFFFLKNSNRRAKITMASRPNFGKQFVCFFTECEEIFCLRLRYSVPQVLLLLISKSLTCHRTFSHVLIVHSLVFLHIASGGHPVSSTAHVSTTFQHLRRTTAQDSSYIQKHVCSVIRSVNAGDTAVCFHVCQIKQF